MRFLIFGTHPEQHNGYAKVVNELVRELCEHRHEIQDVFVFGFQNMPHSRIAGRAVPASVTVFDAAAHEEANHQVADENRPKRGFGFECVKGYVEQCRPDVVLIFNDMHVVCSVLERITRATNRDSMKVIAYLDQVYEGQKPKYVRFLREHADAVIAYSASWCAHIKTQGLPESFPVYELPHGVNPAVYYPIPSEVVRRYHGFKDTDFIILNLNRNQPRKRWDICIEAFAELVRINLPSDDIKLLVATNPVGGRCAWDIYELLDKEMKARGIDVKEGRRRVLFQCSPHMLTDRDVNLLYNACDVGINTCDGEGFGLCNVEHAAVGKPQVVPRLGSFPDVFENGISALLVDPVTSFHLESHRDAIGGKARMCRATDFAEALDKYYKSPEMRKQHGAAARGAIMSCDAYSWPALTSKLVDILYMVDAGRHVRPKKGNEDDEDVMSLKDFGEETRARARATRRVRVVSNCSRTWRTRMDMRLLEKRLRLLSMAAPPPPRRRKRSL